MMEKKVIELEERIESLKVAAKKLKPGQDLETKLQEFKENLIGLESKFLTFSRTDKF